MSGSITSGGGENVPGIPGACTNRNFTYLVRGPWAEHAYFWLWSGCSMLLTHESYAGAKGHITKTCDRLYKEDYKTGLQIIGIYINFRLACFHS